MDEDEKIGLKKMFNYINKVYSIGEKLHALTDPRKRRSIGIQTTVLVILVGFIVQKASFNAIFNHKSFQKRTKNLFRKGTKLPGLDAAREIVENLDTKELKRINEEVIEKVQDNRVLQKGTIDGFVVAAIDGMELFGSYNKCCEECLERKHTKKGELVKEYFHRAVVCMTVGSDPHIILGEEMLHPRDGDLKDEGEPTGAKRLVGDLYKKHGHFADVVVADALYLNAPFIETITNKSIDIVIRSKDANRKIMREALELVKEKSETEIFNENKIEVKVWDIKGLHMEGVKNPLRFLQFKEKRKGKKAVIKRNKGKQKSVKKTYKTVTEEVTVWVFTTLDALPQTIWRIIHKRWDIENNGFHQLKTYYHANHCFDHKATENVFLLTILAFNLRELYLYRRRRNFRFSKQTRVDVTNEWLDDLLLFTFYECFEYDTG